MEYVIEMNNITKALANDDITLQVKQGRYMLYLEKMVQEINADECVVRFVSTRTGREIKGNPVKITNPNIADWCLFIILQLQRILFWEMNRKKGKIAVEEAAKEIKQLSEQYGLAVDPCENEDISVGMQQRVENIKDMWCGDFNI